MTLAAGVTVLFVALCATYMLVPTRPRAVALRVAGRARRDARDRRRRLLLPALPANVSSLRAGTTFVFVLIALVWFYVLALIVLGGAVVNELRFERLGGKRSD